MASVQFDYTKARDSGLSDQQIFDHLKHAKAAGTEIYLDQNEVKSYKPKGKGDPNYKPVELPPEPPSFMEQVKSVMQKTPSGIAGNLAIGAGKEFLDLPRQAASLGTDIGNRLSKMTDIGGAIKNIAQANNNPLVAGAMSLLPKNSIEQGLGKIISPEQAKQVKAGMEQGLEKPVFGEPVGGVQKAGAVGAKIAEFLLPGDASLQVGKAAEKAVGVGRLAKAASLGARSLSEGVIGGGITALQQGKIDTQAKVNAIVSAMFPLAGAALSAGKRALGAVGEKIESSIIRPNATDLKDGFNMKNLQKYDVGGSLKDIIAKTHVKLNSLSQQLKSLLKSGEGDVNLMKVFQETTDELTKNSSKNFGDVLSIKRVLENNLFPELSEQAIGKDTVDLAKATDIKRGAGTKGAWAYSRPEPDASSIEKVYTTFYNKLKVAIEKNAPDGVKEINKQISELIPISNAALRRLPVEMRNNMISLTDSIGLFAAMFDPRELALIGANKLAKSGTFGNFLMKVAETAKNPSVTSLGERVFGK